MPRPRRPAWRRRSGLLANTCIESTSRFAVELGYHVTLVRGATAAWTQEMLHAAHDLNGPTYAHAIVTTDEIVTAFEGTQPAPRPTGVLTPGE